MISILLATYNGEKYIKKSVDSILNQTFENFELLVGFNGTIDNSKQILNSYNDPRIKIFDYFDDKGKAKTLNKLLKKVNSEWICLQDDDDVWMKNKLEKQINFLKDHDVVGSYIKYIDEYNNIIGEPKLYSSDEDIKYYSLNGINQIANTTAIFKKTDAIEVNGWDENLDGIEDYDFWLKLIKKNKKFINIQEYMVFHRIHSNSNFNTKKYNLTKIL